ncbi:Hypothetical predicted protein [Podarcis lilfordi]|uniref:Uncharacterized protein n=1 Tax=Podarcis lilfordi TaxID=74358 RepID=A0AA35KJU8_9SAUR|nr:Hypothetical predicted protein [Podarcis lilfordi]
MVQIMNSSNPAGENCPEVGELRAEEKQVNPKQRLLKCHSKNLVPKPAYTTWNNPLSGVSAQGAAKATLVCKCDTSSEITTTKIKRISFSASRNVLLGLLRSYCVPLILIGTAVFHVVVIRFSQATCGLNSVEKSFPISRGCSFSLLEESLREAERFSCRAPKCLVVKAFKVIHQKDYRMSATRLGSLQGGARRAEEEERAGEICPARCHSPASRGRASKIGISRKTEEEKDNELKASEKYIVQSSEASRNVVLR